MRVHVAGLHRTIRAWHLLSVFQLLWWSSCDWHGGSGSLGAVILILHDHPGTQWWRIDVSRWAVDGVGVVHRPSPHPMVDTPEVDVSVELAGF